MTTTIRGGWLQLEKVKLDFERLFFLLAIDERQEAVLLFGPTPENLRASINLRMCSLRDPKKKRKGREHAFRLNVNSGPHQGKLILDPGSADERRAWLLALSNPVQALKNVQTASRYMGQTQPPQHLTSTIAHTEPASCGQSIHDDDDAVSVWLTSIGYYIALQSCCYCIKLFKLMCILCRLQQYADAFEESGFDDLDIVAEMTESDLMDAVTTASSHRWVDGLQFSYNRRFH
eukprot:SAG31_NODE_2938_length_4883_cov_21.311521_6_plen_233_part_00